MSYSAVLFDFDGTLTNSLPLWRNAIRLALLSFGVELTPDEVVRRCFYRNWAEVALEFGIAETELFGERILSGLQREFLDATLFPGAIDAVKACAQTGVALGIVTSSPRKVVGQALPFLKLDSLFQTVISADDVKRHKPDPEPIEKALSVLAVHRDDTVMVGDSQADLGAAKAAKTASALFLPEAHQEFYCFTTLRGYQPDHIFHCYSEFMGCIGLEG